jgi:hypothetical protein
LLPEQAGAISEGFGDYWAVTVSDVVAKALGVPELEPLPCVADWDSTSYTSTVPHCLRRVDTNLHYPGDLNGEVHHDGQIWSRALWDIRQNSATPLRTRSSCRDRSTSRARRCPTSQRAPLRRRSSSMETLPRKSCGRRSSTAKS